MSDYAYNFERYRKFLNIVLRYDLQIFEIPKESLILDVGCGFGEDVHRLLELGYSNVIGIDPDPYCISKRGDFDLRLGSIENTGFEDQSFDMVLVNNVFHHISDYKVSLNEISRVLKSGGCLCFIEPRPSILRQILDFVTFNTPLPRLFGGPFHIRHEVVGEEFATGLYPKWLKEYDLFFELLQIQFNIIFLKRSPLFIFSKAEKVN